MRRRWVMGRGLALALLVTAALFLTSCNDLRRMVKELVVKQDDSVAPAASYLPPPAAHLGPPLPDLEIPSEPPFVGKPGVDSFGYPLKRPDKIMLAYLLRRRRFDLLDQFMLFYQEQFELDFHKEYWPHNAVEAFAIPDPALRPLLNVWVETSPKSFAPWLARANYLNAVGWHYRDGKLARETSKAQFSKMREYHALAIKDLEVALKLRKGLVVALAERVAIGIADGTSDDLIRSWVEHATDICPQCYEVRAIYLYGLTPRWGGSYEKMERYASEVKPLVASNGKLALLQGLTANDRCKTQRAAKHFAAARLSCAAALDHGVGIRALITHLELLEAEERYAEMLPVADRALTIEPQNYKAHKKRYWARLKTKDYQAAARDLLVARQLMPTDEWLSQQVPWMVKRLRYAGDQRRKVGQNQEATEIYELALQLVPNSSDLKRRIQAAQGEKL